jgi:hypothetical protein
METVTTALLWLCLQGTCIEVTPHAMAVAACESGDTVTLGTGSWTAYNDNVDGSTDGGAWQFNDYWVWNTENLWVIAPFARSIGMDSATFLQLWPSPQMAPPHIQRDLFEYLWADGAGAWHWSASQHCWAKWVTP